MERGEHHHGAERVRRKPRWDPFDGTVAIAKYGLKLTVLHERGVRNALDIRLKRIDLPSLELPPEFDGFTIMQLSDLHVDLLTEAFEIALEIASHHAVDLCVLTGDYVQEVGGSFEAILPLMERLRRRIQTRHGILGVLGNHDRAEMVEAFEAIGIGMLVNESTVIERGHARLSLTGTDDVHYFYSHGARDALKQAPEGFRIALVHSAEIADVAAETGHQVYLAGHTHGGQICLPGGRPLITRLSRFRAYAAGLWRHGDMVGYTSSGVGVSGVPVRFNSRGEVVLFTLRQA
jgi:predicted MPP superfamily phosphohydrolase